MRKKMAFQHFITRCWMKTKDCIEKMKVCGVSYGISNNKMRIHT